MAESYTTPHSLPILGTSDLIRHPTGDNLRKQLNAIAQAANNALTAEGMRAEAAAKEYADAGKFTRPALADGTDLNTVKAPGTYPLANLATLLNGPTGVTSAGYLLVGSNGHPTLPVVIQQIETYTQGTHKRVTGSATAQTFKSWEALHLKPTLTQKRDGLVDVFRRRRGRVIGTGGKAVVSFRFDHGLTNFETVILPLLKKYNLPAMVTMNSRTWADASNSGMTQAEAQAAWLNNGIEFTNHAAEHGAADTEAKIEEFIVTGLAELNAQFPQSPIEMYCPPGAGGTEYMGFSGGDTVAKWYETFAGQTILTHHAAASGYLAGIYRPLPANLDIGLVHYTMDTLTPATVESAVRGTISAKAALVLMFHPVYVNTAGYMTTANLEQVFAYVATKRDAGELEVLTGSGSLLADPSTDARHNLVTNGRFTNGLTDWTGAGWTTATINGVQWVSTTTGTTLTQTVSLSRIGELRGGNRELVYKVRSGNTASVVVVTTVTNGSQLVTTKQHTIPVNTYAEVRQPLSIPLTDGADLTVTVGRVSGGSVDITDIRLQSI